jgi:Flp pilus assembly protein TadG
MDADMTRSRGQREQGIAMVEFTIILPLILLLILGVAELGRAFVRYNALTKAVRDGARYAASYALLGTTQTVNIDSQLTDQTQKLVVFGNTAGTGLPILQGLAVSQVTLVNSAPGEIRVDVAYPYQPLFGSALPDFGLGSALSLSFDMQASVVMRAL